MPGKALSIRFNDEEWKVHEKLKEFFGIRDTFGEDAATIKLAEIGLYNVLQGLFGKKLFDLFRRKYSSEKAIQGEKEGKNSDNVIQSDQENP